MAKRDMSIHDPSTATRAINSLGVDLLTKAMSPRDNALLSPYSIQTALAMVYAGADGGTRAEMARVLHYDGDEARLHQDFARLAEALAHVTEMSAQQVEYARRDRLSYHHVSDSDSLGGPIEFVTANGLFGQEGFAYRGSFLDFIAETYHAPLQPVDFARDAERARTRINGWVEERTQRRVVELVPQGALDRMSRLVVVNAIYLKASWEGGFDKALTQPRPFHVRGGAAVDVPTMQRNARFGYSKEQGYTVVTIPYTSLLQFLVLLPDEGVTLADLESTLTGEILAVAARAGQSSTILELPKFKIEPPLMLLGQTLRSMGMTTAFDQPKGSANFDRIAPLTPPDYLCISEVFHKTFMNLDENGTEAAGATAIAIMLGAAQTRTPPPPPEVVKVDRPFVFAIQHAPSGACLFLGHVTDPR